MMSTAVVIARFQTPFLHEGHTHLLEHIFSLHHKVVVVLGISPVRGSRRNPFDFYTRDRMLRCAYPSLTVLPLPDHPSDRQWSFNLDHLLQSSFPGESFVLYGSRDSFIPFYTGDLPVKELERKGSFCATSLRDAHACQVMASVDFRLGINYACHNRYAQVIAAVVILLFRNGRTELLMGTGKKAEGWQIPGGFVNVGDESLEAAAKRKLRDACGAIETGRMEYLGSKQIDDWRYRKEEEKIISTAFMTDILFGHPVAGDGLQQLTWFTADCIGPMLEKGEVAPEHRPLLKLLLAGKENAHISITH